MLDAPGACVLCAAMDKGRIASLLSAAQSAYGQPLVVVESTGSTNDDARRAAAEGAPHGAAFLAEQQTEGRGRGGHSWFSPPACNVYLSLVMRPKRDAAAMASMTLAVGVAVAELVDGWLLEPRASIKWPNDIFVDGRKLAGILVEATTRGDAPPQVIVGIGLNVAVTSFPPQLSERATSLSVAGSKPIEREAVAAALIARVGRALDEHAASGLASFEGQLQARDMLLGQRIRAGERVGVAAGIDALGCLRLRDDDGAVHLVSSGEIERVAS